MLQAFVVTLREGIEAFLIVAISLAYLRRVGRSDLAAAVRRGIAASIALSALAGWLFSRASNQALWEGTLAIGAALLVATMTIHMWRAARRLKGEIEGRLGRSALLDGRAGWLSVFLFTLVMISREGMEAAMLLGSLAFQGSAGRVLGGALLGLAAAAALAWIWARHGHRVDLALFFQVTAIFLMLFVAQLLIYGFHELTEAGILPMSETLHWATEPYGPDGVYGQYLSYLLVALPGGWLAFSLLRRRRSPVSTGIGAGVSPAGTAVAAAAGGAGGALGSQGARNP